MKVEAEQKLQKSQEESSQIHQFESDLDYERELRANAEKTIETISEMKRIERKKKIEELRVLEESLEN